MPDWSGSYIYHFLVPESADTAVEVTEAAPAQKMSVAAFKTASPGSVYIKACKLALAASATALVAPTALADGHWHSLSKA